MHIVAITRGPRTHVDGSYRAAGAALDAPLESWLAPVAAILSMLPYDLRLKLAGAPPWLVARLGEAEKAAALVSQLEALGCEVVRAEIESLKPMVEPSRVFLRDDGVVLEPQQHVIPYAELMLIVCATIEEERTTTIEAPKDVRRLGATPATRPVHERTKQRAIYLFERSRPEGVRIIEGAVGFQHIEGTTSRARCDAFLRELRERSDARVEDRMLTEPRRQTSYAVHLYEAARGVNQGNLRETDLAATLLARSVGRAL